MSKPDDGGSAFPVVIPGHLYGDGSGDPPFVESRGISLRDYFAAHAMVQQVHLVGLGSRVGNPKQHYNFADLARQSYQIADAMLDERSKT